MNRSAHWLAVPLMMVTCGMAAAQPVGPGRSPETEALMRAIAEQSGFPMLTEPAPPVDVAARDALLTKAVEHLDASLKDAPDDAALRALREMFAAARGSTATLSRLERRTLQLVIGDINMAGAFNAGFEPPRGRELRIELMTQTEPAVRMQPDSVVLWVNRLSAAIDLGDRLEGWRAARALLALRQDVEGSDPVIDTLAQAKRRDWLHPDSRWIQREDAKAAELERARLAEEKAAATREAEARFTRWNGTWRGVTSSGTYLFEIRMEGKSPTITLAKRSLGERREFTFPGTYAVDADCSVPLSAQKGVAEWIDAGETLRFAFTSEPLACNGLKPGQTMSESFTFASADRDTLILGEGVSGFINSPQLRNAALAAGMVLRRQQPNP